MQKNIRSLFLFLTLLSTVTCLGAMEAGSTPVVQDSELSKQPAQDQQIFVQENTDIQTRLEIMGEKERESLFFSKWAANAANRSRGLAGFIGMVVFVIFLEIITGGNGNTAHIWPSGSSIDKAKDALDAFAVVKIKIKNKTDYKLGLESEKYLSVPTITHDSVLKEYPSFFLTGLLTTCAGMATGVPFYLLMKNRNSSFESKVSASLFLGMPTAWFGYETAMMAWLTYRYERLRDKLKSTVYDKRLSIRYPIAPEGGEYKLSPGMTFEDTLIIPKSQLSDLNQVRVIYSRV